MKNVDELAALITERLKGKTARECIELLEAEGVPCGPINTVADMLADPHATAREMVVELEHPRAGRTRALGLPVKLSATPGKIARPAPLLGEHTRVVLAEFGFGDAEIHALIEQGAVFAAAAVD
jgi:crotonobetainyl-CoA:carnitine CoA-transferase CaiB-like acyl-CoA transferase